MKLAYKHFIILCIMSSSIGFYILSGMPLYMSYGANSNMKREVIFGNPPEVNNEEACRRKSTAQRLLDIIQESDSTFSLFGFDGHLDRMDLLCWMYLSQTASKKGLKANTSHCLQSLYEKERNLVPQNVFYVIYGMYNFTFLNYMSVLSIRRVMHEANIYVIGDKTPTGFWWTKVLADVNDIRIVYRKRIHSIFDRFISMKEHVTDIVRLQILILCGGIYLDPDIIFLRPIDDFRRPTLTMGLLDPGTGLGNGLIFTKRHSKFLKYWYESYENFDYKIWGEHSMKIPLLLSNIYSHLINVDKEHIYSPNWFEIDKLFVKLVPWDKNIAIHMWTRHKYPIPQTPKEIDSLNTTAGQMLRFVYYNDKRLR